MLCTSEYKIFILHCFGSCDFVVHLLYDSSYCSLANKTEGSVLSYFNSLEVCICLKLTAHGHSGVVLINKDSVVFSLNGSTDHSMKLQNLHLDIR